VGLLGWFVPHQSVVVGRNIDQRDGEFETGLTGQILALYERYFGNIIAEGQRAGIQFSGLPWSDCGCATSSARYATLRAGGQGKPNAAIWQALLNLVKQGRFRSRTVSCFFDSSEKESTIHQKASEGVMRSL